MEAWGCCVRWGPGSKAHCASGALIGTNAPHPRQFVVASSAGGSCSPPHDVGG